MLLNGAPSEYANQIAKQAKLATGTVFNCYRSTQRPLPLALLYPFFADFNLKVASTASLNTRDILFTTDLCRAMQDFASLEKNREKCFGDLFEEYLHGTLSDTVELQRQTRGKSILDIRLQATVDQGCSSADSIVPHEHLYRNCLTRSCLQIADQWVTLVYIEVKREAGQSGDAQQAGMAYHMKDCATEAFMMTWQTLRPALLITVKQCSMRRAHSSPSL